MDKDKDKEAGVLWMKISAKGNEYYQGNVFGKQVVMFPTPAEKRAENHKLPSFRIYESTPAEGK